MFRGFKALKVAILTSNAQPSIRNVAVLDVAIRDMLVKINDSSRTGIRYEPRLSVYHIM